MELSSQTSNHAEIYSGRDELEAMKLAENYNNFIVQLIEQSFASSSQQKLELLDFGAGNGLFADKLKKLGNKVQCVEIDPPLIAEIQSKGIQVQPSVESYPTQKFIYSLNVLEHIEKDVETLKMLHSRLLPGGKLFLYVPAFQILFSSNDRRVGHFRRYKRRDLCSKLQSAGFQVENSGYVDCVGFFCTLLYKFIGSKDGSINPKSLIFFDRFLFPMNKILDPLLSRILGKNAYAVATKIG